MPNRPKGRYLHPVTNKRMTADPRSNRSRFNGAELADGKFQSVFDLHLMEANGCDLSKIAVAS